MKLLFLLPFLIFGQIGTVHHNFNWLDDSMRIDSIKTRSIYSDNYYNIDTADVDNLSLYLGQKLNVSDSSNLARKVHVHDTSDVTNLSLYLGQKLDVSDTSNLARKVHDHIISDVAGLQDALDLKLDVTELDNYYTKTNLSTSGESQVHWNNITDEPAFITGVDWDEIGGTQSLVNVSGFNNDAGYLTENPFDQDLNTTDRVKFDGVINQNAGVDSYHYRNVASTRLSGPNTGTIKITMPQSWSNTMLTIKISGYEHDAGWWECIITGYNYSIWSNISCELRGNPPFSDVRLAHDGTKCCLLLGNTSTSWRYPNIHITDVITGHSNYSGWFTGWSIDLITDESGISKIATPDVDRPWHSGNLDTSDYYTKTNLQTSGQSSVHWGNVINAPSFITGVNWNEIGGTQSDINMSGFNNDAGYLTDIGGKPWVYKGNEYSGSLRGGYNTTRNHNSGVQDAPVSFMTIGNFNFYGTNYDFQMGATYSGANRFFLRSFFGNAGVWNPWVEILHSGNLDPSDYALVSHNHSASDINSGTLSNDRLSFNPDYFVQGTDSYRRDNYTSTNTLDDNSASGFFRLDPTDPANPDGIVTYYGFRTRTNSNYSVELVGRAAKNKLLFSGLDDGIRQPWREIWHSGNLDTANIVNRTDEQYINGTKHFSSKLYAGGGVYTTYNVGSSDRYWRFRDGLFLFYNGSQIMGCNPVTGNKLKWEVPFDIRDKVEISDTLMLGNKAVSGDNIVAQYIKNNSVSDSTSASINFGLAQSAGYHHAAIKGMRTNKGAGHASSIYLQARPAVSGIGTGHLEDVVEAGFDDQQAFVKYHNNPPVIHSEYGIISSSPNSQTLNPTKGVYICGGSTLGLEIILDTTGVENGQTVKILKSSNLLARVRYGAPGNYQWRAIGHSGAAEFIHYNGEWFCLGAEWEN